MVPYGIVTFVISTFGPLGAQVQALIKDIGRRTNLFVPPTLAHESSWATMSITLDQLLLFKSVISVLQPFSANPFQMTSSPLLLKLP